MAITWTKTFSSGDDGSVLTGAQIGQIQTDIDTYAMSLAGIQTVSGLKTFQGDNVHSGDCTFSGANTHSGAATFSSTADFTGAVTASNTVEFSGAVTFTDKSAIGCLSSTSVDMKTATSTSLYTVPDGKTLIVTHVVVREPSASLSGGTSYSFGTYSACTTWKQTVSLTTLTTISTDFMVIDSNNTKYTTTAAGSAFGIKVTTGSTAAATATVDVFGYLF